MYEWLLSYIVSVKCGLMTSYEWVCGCMHIRKNIYWWRSNCTRYIIVSSWYCWAHGIRVGTHCIIELWAWGRNIIVRGTKPRGKVVGTRPRIVGTPRKNCGHAKKILGTGVRKKIYVRGPSKYMHGGQINICTGAKRILGTGKERKLWHVGPSKRNVVRGRARVFSIVVVRLCCCKLFCIVLFV